MTAYAITRYNAYTQIIYAPMDKPRPATMKTFGAGEWTGNAVDITTMND